MKRLIIFFILSHIISFSQEGALDYLYPNEKLVLKYQDDWGRNNYKKVIKEFKKHPLNFGDIVFLGNSITAEGKDWSERLSYPNIKNRGIGGDVTEGVLARIDEITYFKPKAVFLLIGINDLWNNTPNVPSVEYISSNIIKISNVINKISPNTKIYIQTILPVEKEVYKENIISINSILKQAQNKNPYKIIDLYSVFVNDQGTIKSELSTDGVHLSEKGYDIWTKFIKPTILSMKQ